MNARAPSTFDNGTFPAATSAAWLTVDLGALVENWRLLSSAVAPARSAAVVKADAYGLGATPVVRALLAAGCREFFVALVDEGVRLLDELGPGWPADARLHVLHGALPGAERDCVARGLVPVLNSLDQIQRWQTLARDQGRALPAAIQFDTGMARLGLAPLDAAALAEAPQRLEGIQPTLIISHLASAEEPDNALNAQQLQRFSVLRALWPHALGSLANSSGIFLGSAFHFDLARPGAALYGVAPMAGRFNPMRPVVRVQARLIQWRDIAPRDAVGYNHTWRAERPSRIATVSVGYADGYLRSASNRACLRLGGAVLPVIGRVSMDTVTVDATGVPADRLEPGTPLDVIDDVHDINALAEEAGTNAYEILTSLGARYQRRYLTP
ncbi:MAG: alanine racemase [Burkholderiaceae bacterium]|nr:alanine racemase [Burkholderiaceae bacterium]